LILVNSLSNPDLSIDDIVNLLSGILIVVISDLVYTSIIGLLVFLRMSLIISSSAHRLLEESMNLTIISALLSESTTLHLRCIKNSSFHSFTHGVSKKII